MNTTAKKVAVVAAAVLALGGAGAGLALADTTSGTADPTATTATAGHPHARHGRALGEHGEITRHTKDGDRTVDVQRGTVDAVSPTSITVTSRDGFRQTYAFTPTTKVRKDKRAGSVAQVAVGDRVGLAALHAPQGLQVLRIRDAGPATTPAG